jgi:hypothetical protein
MLEVFERVGQPFGFPAQVCFHVVEDRVLVEVIADHARHIGVYRLVVCHALHFGAVVWTAVHEIARYRAVAQKVSLIVNIRQKEVQCLDALDKATLNVRPFPGE